MQTLMTFCATFKGSRAHTAYPPVALTFSALRHFQLGLDKAEMSERRPPAGRRKNVKGGHDRRSDHTESVSLFPWVGGYNLWAKQSHVANDRVTECVTQEERRAQTWLQAKVLLSCLQCTAGVRLSSGNEQT